MVNLKYSFTVNNGIVYIPILHMKSLPKWKGTASMIYTKQKKVLLIRDIHQIT